MKKKYKSHGLYKPRFRKDDHTHNMQAAVIRWVKAQGGAVVVVGGVGIMDEGPLNFYVCVKCTGRKPKKPEPKPDL